jgi:NAD(P)H dehydrogenase (quinone)
MKVLVVYAHPNPQSFNHAILESFTDGLKKAGHSCEVSDLYAAGFDACFKSPDFAQFSGGKMPADVVREQQKVAGADAMAFIYPVWWWAPPAILKGWYDRVLAAGFAYGEDEQGKPVGLLKHKKVVLITTTLGEEESYQGTGIAEAITTIDRATFTVICGIPNVEHVFLYSVAAGDETRKKYLELVHKLGQDL